MFRVSNPARNLADISVNASAVLTATTTATGFDAANLLTRDHGRKWRGDTNDEWLTVDLGSSQPIHMIAVAGHNLGRDGGGRFQVQASDDGTWADIPYDPGPEAIYWGVPIIHYAGGRVFRYVRIRLLAYDEAYAEATWLHVGDHIEIPSGLAYGFRHEIVDGRIHIFRADSGYNQVSGSRRREITGRLSRVTHAVADDAISQVQAINGPVFCDPCQGTAGQEIRNRCYGPVFIDKIQHPTSKHATDVDVVAHDLRLDRIHRLPVGVDDGLLLYLPLDGRPLPSWVTFARASTGTYIDPADGLLKTAAIDVPRYEQMADGSVGVLLEGASTNVALRSAGFDSWVPQNGASPAGSNAAVAPDGTVSADLLTFPNLASSWYVTVSQIVIGTVITLSVWASESSIGKQFRFQVKTVADGRQYSTDFITGPTLQRYEYTFTVTAGESANLYLNNDSAGVAGSMYAWGFQAEELPFASSYIPTTTVPVTRTADSLNLLSALNAPVEVGTIVFYFQPLFTAAPGAYQMLSANNFLYENQTGVALRSFQSGFGTIQGQPFDPLNTHAIVFRWNKNGRQFFEDGIPGEHGAMTELPSFGSNLFGVAFTARHFALTRDFRIYPRALTDAEIAAL